MEEESRPRFVTLRMNLMGWQYSNGTLVMKEDSCIHDMLGHLTERHGNMSELKVCKGIFAEETEMTDEFKPLGDYGFVGAYEGEAPAIYEIFYDFKARNPDDPLLLCLSNAPDKKRPELPPSDDGRIDDAADNKENT